MASLNDLKLTKEVIEHDVADLDALPAQMGMRTPTLQPGPYVFALPALAALREAFDVVKREGEPDRLAVVFRDEAALIIAQAPDKELVGKPFNNRLSNVARKRGKGEVKVSDLDYLLQALGEKKMPNTNPAYGEAILRYAGRTFGADVELSYYCNNKNPIRTEDASGQTVTLDGQEGRGLQKGCGSRFYQKDVSKDEETGKFPIKIGCDCGAILYANENLVRFRKVTA